MFNNVLMIFAGQTVNQSFYPHPRGQNETYRLIIRTHLTVETADITARPSVRG